MESTETSDGGGHPHDNGIGLHHSQSDNVFLKVNYSLDVGGYQERLVDD